MKKIKNDSVFNYFLTLLFIPFVMYSMSLLGQSVVSVSPLSASLKVSQPITITGTGFIPGATQVYFGDILSPSVTVNSSTSLIAMSPATSTGASLVPGTVDITVQTINGTSLLSQDDRFAFRGEWLAFIPDFSTSQVHVIDTNMDAEIISIGVQSDPNDISITADGKTAYCVNSGSNSISVIDVATLQVINTIMITPEPDEQISFPILMALSQNPLTSDYIGYTANYGSANVSQINLTTGEILQTVPSGGNNPTGIMVTSGFDGENAVVYVTNTGGSISRIDFSSSPPTIEQIINSGSPIIYCTCPRWHDCLLY